MAQLSLQVHEIDDDGKDYSFPLPAAWLDAQLVDSGLRADPARPEGSLEVHAQKNGAEYLVTGQLDVDLVTECSRCLGEAKVPAHLSFAYLFSRDADPGKLDAEFDPDSDELSREPFSGHEIILDDIVREHLVLECPMQPLCSPDCKGIAVPAAVRPPEDVFGPSEGGVDPRLAPLLRLRDKVPPNKE